MDINAITELLIPFENIVFNEQESFLAAFALKDACELKSLSFTSLKVLFEYTLNSGEHKSGETSIELFDQWIFKN